LEVVEESKMSLKVLIAPQRYVQGPDALTQMGEQLQGIGIFNPLEKLGLKKATAADAYGRAF
jgi:hypothetical protein